MAHLNYALVGDSTYAGRFKIPPNCSDSLKSLLRDFGRQALHAKKLSLIHPSTGEELSWEVDLPEDMLHLIASLKAGEDI